MGAPGSAGKTRVPETVYEAVGCDECRHTGYKGRIRIYETLLMDKAMRKLINTSNDLKYITMPLKNRVCVTCALAGRKKWPTV